MLRFPNPGSDIRSFVSIFQAIHRSLSDKKGFTLDDMSLALTTLNLAASSGYVGRKALYRSTRADRSRDPLYNQSKMYAELFRSLGLVTSRDDKRLFFRFTFLGDHLAATTDPMPLFEQCLLGISYPNEVIDNKVDFEIRPFLAILRTLDALGGRSCRDELILGPLNMGDRDSKGFLNMIGWLKEIRGNHERLKTELKKLSGRINISINTMGNYTRFPLAAIEHCGWVTKSRDNDLYPGRRNMVILELTEYGKERARWANEALDLRLSDLSAMDRTSLAPIIRHSFYAMLKRGGFDIEPMDDFLDRDEMIISDLSKGRDILLSPYQCLKFETVNEALEISSFTFKWTSDNRPEEIHEEPSKFSSTSSLKNSILLHSNARDPVTQASTRFDNLERLMENAGQNPMAIVEYFVSEFSNANKDVFYPLVADLFSYLGFNCTATRHGINYERWDAIIDEPPHSIPIEIKSPAEEQFISVKAVRQSLS
ncbi:MAG: hypothetical protein ACOX57_00680 [Limnochordia bacterium]|jgi:hypothetical protein